MKKEVRFLLSLLIVFLLTGGAAAQGPGPQHTDPVWQAAYWNNTDLAGTPVLWRAEANLDHDWGTGSPAPEVNADYFSARWTRYIYVPSPATYRFTATSDDGVRVWLDGALIINQWSDGPARTVSVDRALSAGHHLIIVEFYERTGGALIRFSWDVAPPTITNWRGEYYNNPNLEGSPALVRDDAQINFNWGTGAPAPGISTDNFSVRWTRNLSLPAGIYRFTMTVDDGGRLWVNDHLLLDAWREQAETTYVGDIYLPGGNIPVKIEYYERAGHAVAKLSWQRIDGSTPPTPPAPAPGTVIVDDTDAGFVTGGSATGWRVAYVGYNGRMLWTYNNDRIRTNYNWARWYPRLRAGWYEVFVYIPSRNATTTKARYWISHADGFTLRVVNQSAYGNQWVSLGTYRFRGTRDDYVSLADVTFEPRLSRQVGFDAVKWVPKR